MGRGSSLLEEGGGVFVGVYKYMHIYLWTALRIMPFWRTDLWFLEEGFDAEVFLAAQRWKKAARN